MSRLGRLKRECKLIEKQIQNSPEGKNKAEKELQLQALERLIEIMQFREEDILSALEDEWEAERKRSKSADRCAALVALVMAFASLAGYSANIPWDATEEELLRVLQLLHSLVVQQSIQRIGYSPPVALTVGPLPSWVIPYPEIPSISNWRDNQSRHNKLR